MLRRPAKLSAWVPGFVLGARDWGILGWISSTCCRQSKCNTPQRESTSEKLSWEPEKRKERKRRGMLCLLLLFLKESVGTLGYSGGQEDMLMLNSLSILTALYSFQFETNKCDFDVFWGIPQQVLLLLTTNNCDAYTPMPFPLLQLHKARMLLMLLHAASASVIQFLPTKSPLLFKAHPRFIQRLLFSQLCHQATLWLLSCKLLALSTQIPSSSPQGCS